MEHISDTPRGVCSRHIDIDLENDVIRDVKISGGCAGNTQGVAILADGLEARAAIKRLKGVECHGGTSCPDQLAIAIAQCLESMGESV